MSFEDVLAEAMKEPGKVRRRTEISSYPRFLKIDTQDIWYQHKDWNVVGSSDETSTQKGIL